MNRQDLDYQQDNEQWNFADKNWSKFHSGFMKLVKGEQLGIEEVDFLKEYAEKYLQRQQSNTVQNNSAGIWVKASERLPIQSGVENSVTIENRSDAYRFSTRAFKTFGENPSLYFEIGNKSFVTVEGKGNGNSTFPIKDIYWLDESQAKRRIGDKWISANLYGAPKEKGVFFIKYNNGIDKEVGDKITIKELVENGWEDVYYLPNEESNQLK